MKTKPKPRHLKYTGQDSTLDATLVALNEARQTILSQADNIVALAQDRDLWKRTHADLVKVYDEHMELCRTDRDRWNTWNTQRGEMQQEITRLEGECARLAKEKDTYHARYEEATANLNIASDTTIALARFVTACQDANE